MTQAPGGQERRKRPDLRLVFDHVIERIAPFFRDHLGDNDVPLEYWAARTIRDMHAELTTQDVQILVNAAFRYFKARPVESRDVGPAPAAEASG